MKNLIIALGLIIFILSPDSAVAAEESPAKNQGKIFSADIKLGVYSSYGNVERSSHSYKFSVAAKTGANELKIKGEGRHVENQGDVSQDSREMTLLDKYSFSSSSAIYANLKHYKNEFKGYRYKWKLGSGYLHSWGDDSKYFRTRLGYQLRRQKDIHNNIKELGFVLLGCRAKYPIMENIAFKTEINYEREKSESVNYEVDGEFILAFTVNALINMEIKYQIEYDNTPVEGKEKTDRELTVDLVFKF